MSANVSNKKRLLFLAASFFAVNTANVFWMQYHSNQKYLLKNRSQGGSLAYYGTSISAANSSESNTSKHTAIHTAHHVPQTISTNNDLGQNNARSDLTAKDVEKGLDTNRSTFNSLKGNRSDQAAAHAATHEAAIRSTDDVEQNDTSTNLTAEEVEEIPPPSTTATNSNLSIDATDSHQSINEILLRSTTPIPGEKTVAMHKRSMRPRGFRNEAMAFQAFVKYASENNFTQILLSSLIWQDLFGNDRGVEHEKLFDVQYWNSFYPVLPRMVEYNRSLFPHWDNRNKRFPSKNAKSEATTPYAYGQYQQLFAKYRNHLRDVANGKTKNTPADLAMQKAMRPHPDMIQIQHNITHQQQHSDGDDEAKSTTTSSYMALHARIEPDMQRHNVCWGLKVILLQDIFDSIERHFPQPSFNTLFIAVNRNLLETEANDFAKYNNSKAVENLKVLNRAHEHGLWNGTVTVVEAGMPSTKGTRFELYPGVSGAIMDYYLALDSTIFVGTEVSSFSVELITNRFYQQNFESYHYRPQGLVKAVNEGDRAPPKFNC